MAEELDVLVIAGGSPDAHNKIQEWRRRNPGGFLIKVDKSNSFIHRAKYCQHLGDANWDEGRPNWGSLEKRQRRFLPIEIL